VSACVRAVPQLTSVLFAPLLEWALGPEV
jgi:hypothetical protein